MRILIVDAFAGSTSGRQAFLKYEKLVRSAFQAVEPHEQGRAEIIVRHYRKLEDFCYDNEAVSLSSKAAIAAVDKLDFVFVDGDSRLLPWHPRTRQLVVLLRTAIGAKKCLFAAGPGAHIVAFVCATGGKRLRVLNGGGYGGSLLELSTLRPEDLGGNGKPKCGGEAQEVVLDSTNGDFYAFDSNTDRWKAEGNMGIQKIKAGIGGVAAAILADASCDFKGNGCMKKVPVNELLGIKRDVQSAADVSSKALQRPSTPRFQSEVLVRVRPKSIQHRFLKHLPRGEFLAWSPGKWSIGEGTAARCRRTFAVLAASNRAGPEMVEIDNCLATRFTTRQEYQHATGLLQSFVQHKHFLIRSQSRIDRGSEFVMKEFQQDGDFDSLSITSSQKQAAAAAARASKRQAPKGAASRRRQPQGGQKGGQPLGESQGVGGFLAPRVKGARADGEDSAATASGKRTAPFPRRPQPTEKPRLAPPHSTRSIRAGPATGRGRMEGKDQSLFCAAAVATDVKREGEGGGDDRHGAPRAAGADDEGGLAGTDALAPPHDEAQADGGGRSRGADPQGRRRVLMARVGNGIGLDLSPVINALFQGDECDAPTGPNDGQPPQTARTAPAAHGRVQGDGAGLAGCELGVVKADPNQGGADELASRLGMDQDYDGDEDGFSTDGTVKSASGPRCWARRGDKTSAPRRARSVARGPRRGRRDEASNALVRVAGHERKRPYNNLRRFLRMGETTRHVFFSLGRGRVHDGIAASEAPQPAGAVAAESGQQQRAGTVPHGGDNNKHRFSANFGGKEAWQSLGQPTIRTQGPYLGKSWGTSREACVPAQHLVVNPTRWTFSGSKTKGWSGIGEGTGFAKNTY